MRKRRVEKGTARNEFATKWHEQGRLARMMSGRGAELSVSVL